MFICLIASVPVSAQKLYDDTAVIILNLSFSSNQASCYGKIDVEAGASIKLYFGGKFYG